MREMRRKDREMPREFAEAVVDKCRFSVLAMVNPDGTPYCIPLSMTRDGDLLYFHCAKEGQKTDCLRHQNQVCISCVGDTNLPPDDFTIEYESAEVFGTASEVTESEEKIHALRLICRRYTPANMGEFDKAIEKSLDVTAIWKIRIEGISGKKRRPSRK
jgi:nitroimidazol reductase NimA-like FMN-containing flavoprotein (pyridoxamine 5'-phosphate oxidase superfamily)